MIYDAVGGGGGAHLVRSILKHLDMPALFIGETFLSALVCSCTFNEFQAQLWYNHNGKYVI